MNNNNSSTMNTALFTDTIYIDAEWQPRLYNETIATLPVEQQEFYHSTMVPWFEKNPGAQFYPLSVQFRYRDTTRVYVNSLEVSTDSLLKDHPNVLPYNFDDSTGPLEPFLSTIEQEHGIDLPKVVKIALFYSPVDIRLAFGDQVVRGFDTKLEQKRRLRFKDRPAKINGRTYELVDVKGWASGGLKEFLDATGVDTSTKTALDDLKGHLLYAMKVRPQTYLEYAMGDVCDLQRAVIKFDDLIRGVVRDQLGVEWPENRPLPGTVGKLVSDAFEGWIGTRASDPERFKRAARKLGRLKASTVRGLRRRGDHLEDMGDNEFAYLGYQQAGVKAFAELHAGAGDSAGVCALVQGGRCNNEWPSQLHVSGVVADIDLKSCYGTALTLFDYPLGLPTTWGYLEEQKAPSLRKWLKENENDLVPGLWTVYISTYKGTRLSFSQDLLISRDTSLSQVARAYHVGFSSCPEDGGRFTAWGVKEDPSNIPGLFGVVQQQLVNSVITHDVLEVLRRVATNHEIGELLDNTYVVGAAAWLKSNEIESVDEWVDHVLQDKGCIEMKRVRGQRGCSQRVDSRTRGWARLHLGDFIGPLVSLRGRVKSINKPLSNTLKLFINTLYGVLASPYFRVGNTVVANNITAKARLGAWMFNKALHTRQSITDGGFYNVLAVPTLSSEKRLTLPGLNVYSDISCWASTREQRRRGQTTTHLLGDEAWWAARRREVSTDVLTMDELGKTLDGAAKDHLNTYWGRYGIGFTPDSQQDFILGFEIEHKGSHTSDAAAYDSKGHYALRTWNGNVVFKVRGAKAFDSAFDAAFKRHPVFDVLQNVLDGTDELPNDLEYHVTTLLKVGAYNARRDYYNAKNLYLGDLTVETRSWKVNNLHFAVTTLAELRRREAYARGSRNVGYQAGQTTISGVHRAAQGAAWKGNAKK